VDVERLALKAQVNRLFTKSRSSAGSRTIKGMLNDDGAVIGRFKVRRLMSELGLICKQPGPHAYKQATVERPDIPNHLAREFTVDRPNQACVETSPTYGAASGGAIWLSFWICMPDASLVGRCHRPDGATVPEPEV